MPQRPIVILALSTLTWVACNTGIPGNPPAPTPTLPALTRVAITGLPGSLTIGQTVQLTASVTLPDGTTLRTSEVSWTSSDDKVVIVSATGLLTVIGLGEADVTATDRGVRAVVHVVVARPPPLVPTSDISGVVHESAPTEDVVLAGATVGIHFAGCPTCPHEGQETITDDQGRFTLPGIEAAGFTLWARKPGYEATPFNIAMLPRDQHPSVGLSPVFAIVSQVFEGRYHLSDCVPERPEIPGSGVDCVKTVAFPVHHSGPFKVLQVQFSLIESSINVQQGNGPIHYDTYGFVLEPGFITTVTVFGADNPANVEGRTFRVVFTHPN